jgi:ribose 5-phosphate isomerase
MAKPAAALAFVNDLKLENGIVLGIGTGSTSTLAVQHIARISRQNNIHVFV